MKRRVAVWAAFGGWVAAGSLRAREQGVPRIVFIWPGSPSGEAVRSDAFKQGLRDVGLVAGQHYLLFERYADGQYERFAGIVAEELTLKPAIIVVNTIASVRAAQQATRSVPIIFVATNDPVGTGLVASYARPGGNTTGLSSQNEDTVVKQLQLLHEVLPRANRLAVLVNPGNPSGLKLFERLRGAGAPLGMATTAIEVTSPQGLDAAFKAIARLRPDSLQVMSDAMLFSERERITAFGLRERMPVTSTSAEVAHAGALFSYGATQIDLFRRAGGYVKRVLEGAPAGEMPVEQPTRFQLVINLKTARAIGVTIPQSLLLRADEVIE